MDDAPSDHGGGDPLDGLEDRLQKDSTAFESLLALTPAREYYGSHFVDGQDPSEQWNRKKQTKEEKRAAKKAKLDPANNRSALDVMKEREEKALSGGGKRKRGAEDGDGGVEDGHAGKKRRQGDEEDAAAAEARRREKAAKKKEKRQAKTEKKQRQKAKAEERKARKQERDLNDAAAEKRRGQHRENQRDDDSGAEEAELIPEERLADMDHFDVSGLADADEAEREDEWGDAASDVSSTPTTPVVNSPAFDLATNHSASSSSSSIIPPSTTDELERSASLSVNTNGIHPPSAPTPKPHSGISSPKLDLSRASHAENAEKVRKRIEELRAARKADGPDGKPAKSRQELLEQRLKKGDQRRLQKQELRRKAKEEEQRRQDEQLRGSGSPMSMDDIFSPRSPQNSYSFSKLAFDDGTAADPSLTALKDPVKKKGPQDPKTALQAAQTKDARLAGYDAEKRADIAEKDVWANARRKAGGERVRDDTSLLKKALKRKEKQKGKSEKEWQQREQAVVKGKEMKQKKREANLRKRREEKGGKGKKKKGGGGKGKKDTRSGFGGKRVKS